MALISYMVSVMSLLSLSAMFLLGYCVTANNKTNQPAYQTVTYFDDSKTILLFCHINLKYILKLLGNKIFSKKCLTGKSTIRCDISIRLII